MGRVPFSADGKCDAEKAGGLVGEEGKPPRFSRKSLASYAACRYINGFVKVDGDEISEECDQAQEGNSGTRDRVKTQKQIHSGTEADEASEWQKTFPVSGGSPSS
ncbi:hypothetical protein KOW79_004922 [Hemibagrus wyckioides]|uniref:Uncharacterized protein n=1 Tax=Hemibagrus wyckioides TaxID=337641 RepID=A0A9D3NXR9_9TELE|nr:hypothetical protein KOW79_004922 [Hemibagrus wyckioides]